jgi:hypothetical protein
MAAPEVSVARNEAWIALVTGASLLFGSALACIMPFAAMR